MGNCTFPGDMTIYQARGICHSICASVTVPLSGGVTVIKGGFRCPYSKSHEQRKCESQCLLTAQWPHSTYLIILYSTLQLIQLAGAARLDGFTL